MRRLGSWWAFAGVCALATSMLPACAASATDKASAKSEDSKKVDAKKLASQARAVELARGKLAHARLEQETAKRKHDAAVDQARKALSLADEALEDFKVNEAPLRVRKAELGIKAAEDSHAETLEEFDQLKLMYAEQDLADTTRELVMHRTERRIARSKQELELARAELEHLKEGEIAMENAKLELEVSEKQHALEDAQLDSRVSWNEKELAVLEAQHELAEAEAGAKSSQAGKAEKDAKEAKDEKGSKDDDGEGEGEGGDGESEDDG